MLTSQKTVPVKLLTCRYRPVKFPKADHDAGSVPTQQQAEIALRKLIRRSGDQYGIVSAQEDATLCDKLPYSELTLLSTQRVKSWHLSAD